MLAFRDRIPVARWQEEFCMKTIFKRGEERSGNGLATVWQRYGMVWQLSGKGMARVWQGMTRSGNVWQEFGPFKEPFPFEDKIVLLILLSLKLDLKF